MTYEQYVKSLSQKFSEFEVREKSGSILMRLIHLLLFVITLGKNKVFLSDYITTVGYKVYVPELWNNMLENEKIIILKHEVVHMEQMTREGKIKFSLKYLLYPLPIGYANARLDYEAEAYAKQIFEEVQLGYPINFEFAANVLTGPAYFWPTFSKHKVKQRLAFFYKELIKAKINELKSH